MSTLDSLLDQLRQSLSAKQAESGQPAQPTLAAPDDGVNKEQARAALKQFIQQTVLQKAAAVEDDTSAVPPAVSRQALSAFIGSPLGNGIKPPASAPAVAASASAAVQSAVAPAASAAVHAAVGTAPAAPAPSAPPAASSAVGAAPMPPAQSTAKITWFKHILTIESALRIGDAHFAESVLSVLHEVAAATNPDASVRARLKSLQARVRMERKQLAEAEEELKQAIKSLEGTPHVRSMGAAYCLHALAQCHKLQQKPDQAKAVHKQCISIAEECMGVNDPEVKMLKQEI